MNKLTQKFLVVSLLALAGCEGEANSGRLVGFIVDGQTGQRLNFFKETGEKGNLGDDGDSTSQVYAIIDGEFRRARPCGRGDLNDKNAIEADGCFQIDNIPEGMTVPVFAQAPGYERFVGEYTYSLLDYDQEHAQKVANIRLFPKGFSVDYRINVTFNNNPVPNAQIICQYTPTTANTLQVSGIFLEPVTTGTTTVSATSNADGVAAIPGSALVNGASYRCEAVMAQSMDGVTLAGQGNFTAGVSQAEQRMGLTTSGSTDTLLYAVRSTGDDTTRLMGADGKLAITFNRPVEVVPGTADCQYAVASIGYPDADGVTGAIYPTPAGSTTNGVSESVTAEVSSDGLTLTLGFKAERPFDPDDRGTYVTFSGIIVRPRGTTSSSELRAIGGVGACPAVSGYTVGDVSNLRTGGADQISYIQLF
ncbi:hypothetical protein ATI61_10545 [Archangium gephyra]|uniref:Uncharacterized protein n=1 Tax=Archangium gephyra TaxID=48 RepID=A0AAC8TI65_9BACT|nr:hypothetical protein [Archangium gephyra]AKJ06992.1 Hypothetical protein AA314_08618 [Archangium gephyra]REG31721.1 hypothetical protein ATI61_10545 [Archangium gephyra]